MRRFRRSRSAASVPSNSLYWRDAELDFTDVRALIASLEVRSDDPVLRSAPQSIDLAVLKFIAEDPAIVVERGAAARQLWAGVRPARIPQSRADAPQHAWSAACSAISARAGTCPHEWFAAEVARLDKMSGDIEALADRLAGIRSWAYIAHRSNWLKEPARMGRAHARGRIAAVRRPPRTVDPALRRPPHRRAGARHRRARRRRASVTVAADGEVSVGPSRSASSAGFEFRVDPSAPARRQAAAAGGRRAPPGRGARSPRRRL